MGGFGQPNSGSKKKHLPTMAAQKNGNALLQKAITHHLKGDIENAEKEYRAAIDFGLLDVALFSNLATICQKSLRTQEAIGLYKKALEIDPRNSDLFINLGSLYKDIGDINKAISSTHKSLELNPLSVTAHMNMSGIHEEIGNYHKALSSLRKSLKIKPEDPNIIMHLGRIHKIIGNNNQALSCTLKSLELKPDNPDALINLGIIYKNLGRLDQALASTLKSLELKPDNPDALFNLGIIYKNLGRLDQAFASTLKSLELKPDNPAALLNLGICHEIANELQSALERYNQSAALTTQAGEETGSTSLINTTIVLLQMNKIKQAKAALSKASKVAAKKIPLEQSSEKNNRNDVAYLIYLSKLIPHVPSFDSSVKSQILHLGDSHCLTFANQTIELKGKRCTMRPSLIKGAKAFHLSAEAKINAQKTAFERRLRQNLDDYEYIFLTFGEIDCREDEGILLHCKKKRKAIQDISESTARKYFQWTSRTLSRHKEKLVYFGTPAPYRIEPDTKKYSEINDQMLHCITVFNTSLARQCQEQGIFFADVYKLTADRDGYNNDRWMIDSVHLKPEALHKLTKHIQF